MRVCLLFILCLCLFSCDKINKIDGTEPTTQYEALLKKSHKMSESDQLALIKKIDKILPYKCDEIVDHLLSENRYQSIIIRELDITLFEIANVKGMTKEDLCAKKLFNESEKVYNNENDSIVKINGRFMNLNGSLYPLKNIHSISTIEEIRKLKIPSIEKEYSIFSFYVKTNSNDITTLFFSKKEDAENSRLKLVN